jgi:hypothetical protein
VRRSTERELFKLLGIFVLLALAYWLVAWPWIVVRQHGGSTIAGLAAEVAYVAVVGGLIWFGIDNTRKRDQARRLEPGWKQVPTDPAGLRRWWDGTEFTTETQWDFHAVRPSGSAFTHGSYTIRHRTYGAAARCKGTV